MQVCISSSLSPIGPSEQDTITVNGGGINSTVTFPVDQDTITITFPITDDEVGLEELERYVAMLEIVGTPRGVVLGTITSADIEISDNDGEGV